MSPEALPSGYKPRPISFLEVWEAGDWTLKVYGISARRKRPPPEFVSTAKDLALRELPRPATAGSRYGIGILIVHEGADGNYVLVDWWSGENMLHNHVYQSTAGGIAPEDFRYITPTGLCCCVWELHVLHFERTAWINSVLNRDGGPDLDEYLAQRLQGEV